jgi:hypothetical protein
VSEQEDRASWWEDGSADQFRVWLQDLAALGTEVGRAIVEGRVPLSLNKQYSELAEAAFLLWEKVKAVRESLNDPPPVAPHTPDAMMPEKGLFDDI